MRIIIAFFNAIVLVKCESGERGFENLPAQKDNHVTIELALTHHRVNGRERERGCVYCKSGRKAGICLRDEMTRRAKIVISQKKKKKKNEANS